MQQSTIDNQQHNFTGSSQESSPNDTTQKMSVDSAATTDKKIKIWKRLPLILGIIILVPILYYGSINLALMSNSPKDITETEKGQVSSIVMNYLTKKYGDHNFSINHLMADESYNGFSYAGREGYEVTLDADGVDYFSVRTKGKDAKTTVVYYDNFAENYYQEAGEVLLNDWAGLKFSIDVSSGAIPSDYGKMPNYNELLQMGAISDLVVDYDSRYGNHDDEEKLQAEYIRDFTKKMITHFRITEEFEYTYRHYDGTETNAYKVTVDEKNIKIVQDASETSYIYSK